MNKINNRTLNYLLDGSEFLMANRDTKILKYTTGTGRIDKEIYNRIKPFNYKINKDQEEEYLDRLILKDENFNG